jgi:hypothetical protein
VGCRGVGGNGPGAAVDEKDGIVGGRGCHRLMVAQGRGTGIRDQGLGTRD